MTKVLYYECSGSVRGSCGHKHRTPSAAEDCRLRDVRACRSLGGGAYSDRIIVAIHADGYRRDCHHMQSNQDDYC